jgi:hypothetical protein
MQMPFIKPLHASSADESSASTISTCSEIRQHAAETGEQDGFGPKSRSHARSLKAKDWISAGVSLGCQSASDRDRDRHPIGALTQFWCSLFFVTQRRSIWPEEGQALRVQTSGA